MLDLTSKTTTTIERCHWIIPNSKKGEAILNKLMAIYLKDNRTNKLQIADSTLANLLMNRLSPSFGNDFSDIIEKVILNNLRKSQNKIADIEEQSKGFGWCVQVIFQKQLSTP